MALLCSPAGVAVPGLRDSAACAAGHHRSNFGFASESSKPPDQSEQCLQVAPSTSTVCLRSSPTCLSDLPCHLLFAGPCRADPAGRLLHQPRPQVRGLLWSVGWSWRFGCEHSIGWGNARTARPQCDSTAVLVCRAQRATAVAMAPANASRHHTARSFGPALVANRWEDFWGECASNCSGERNSSFSDDIFLF